MQRLYYEDLVKLTFHNTMHRLDENQINFVISYWNSHSNPGSFMRDYYQ